MSARIATINGLPGVLLTGPGGLVQTTAFEFEDGLVKAVYAVRNPDKLRHIAVS
jgi:RNA polymerase sigma-70 factor (ECF subfamily)